MHSPLPHPTPPLQDCEENVVRHGGDSKFFIPVHVKADKLDRMRKAAAQQAAQDSGKNVDEVTTEMVHPAKKGGSGALPAKAAPMGNAPRMA